MKNKNDTKTNNKIKLLQSNRSPGGLVCFRILVGRAGNLGLVGREGAIPPLSPYNPRAQPPLRDSPEPDGTLRRPHRQLTSYRPAYVNTRRLAYSGFTRSPPKPRRDRKNRCQNNLYVPRDRNGIHLGLNLHRPGASLTVQTIYIVSGIFFGCWITLTAFGKKLLESNL